MHFGFLSLGRNANLIESSPNLKFFRVCVSASVMAETHFFQRLFFFNHLFVLVDSTNGNYILINTNNIVTMAVIIVFCIDVYNNKVISSNLFPPPIEQSCAFK
jgi:hypothetical protein